MKNMVKAKVTMLRKESFGEKGVTQTFEPLELGRKEREEQDAQNCPDNIDLNEPQVQVALDGSFVMVRFVDPADYDYERYVGGMNLDFSGFKDGEERAKKIAEAFLG